MLAPSGSITEPTTVVLKLICSVFCGGAIGAGACGAWPLYYASPGHRVHGLGLPENAWVNLFGLSPQAGAAQVSALRFNADMFTAYAHAQGVLAQLFGALSNWTAERRRLASALRVELEQVLDSGPDYNLST